MIVLTLGTFDLLHVGHLELLSACRALAGQSGRVVVAVNRDEFVARFKGHAPTQPLDQRREMLESCRFVDATVINAGDERAGHVLGYVVPDIIAVGDDWRDRDYLGQLGIDQDYLDAHGIRVVYIARTRGVSTSGIRESLAVPS